MSVQNLKINTVRAECGGDIPNLPPETAESLSSPDHYPSRNYGVDLLRIVSIFMVCILHVLGCGGVLSASEGKTITFGIACFLEIFAYCAVDIYALISGYVGFGHSRNALKKWMTMWLQVIFYCILSTAVVSALNPGEIGKGSWLAMIVPFSSNQYWYFSSYSGLLFVMPFLDHIVQSIQKADLKKIFFGIGCILLIGSTSVRLFGTDPLVLKDGYSSLWLVILYLVGAIIKKTGWFQSASKKNLLAIGAVGLLFTWAWKLFFEKSQIEIAGINGDMWISYLSPTIVLAALVLLVIFSGFRRIPQPLIKVIRFITPTVFGVYLFHGHPLVFSYILTDAFTWIADFSPWKIPITVIAVALAIFVCGVLTDRIRMFFFKICKINRCMAWICGKFEERFMAKTEEDN